MPSRTAVEARDELNAAVEPLPSLAVLRGRRTRKRKAVQVELDWLREVARVTDDNRFEILSARSRVDSHAAEIQRINDQTSCHPLLPAGDAQREVDEAENAMDVAVTAKGVADALLDGYDPESVVVNSSDATITLVTAENGQSSAEDYARIETPPTSVSSASQIAVGAGCSTTVVPNAVPSGCGSSRLFLDTIPEPFDGKVSQYKLWRAQFINYVRRRTQATKCDKLVTLTKLLKGSPKELICALPLTDRNYDVALKLLDENYDVPELRQRDVLASLSVVPSVRHQNDTSALRELLNVAQRTILSLQAVDVPLKDIALPYEQTIRKALPMSLLLNFEDRSLQDCAPTSNEQAADQAAAAANRLEKLMSFLRRYVALRERAVASDPAGFKQRDAVGSSSSRSSPRRRWQRGAISTVAAATKGDPRRKNPARKLPCLFCKTPGHQPSACPADLSVKQRLDILKQRRRCSECFRFEHIPPAQCSGPKEACSRCNSKQHYTVMHNSAGSQATTASVVQTIAATSSLRAVVMTASAFVLHGTSKILVRCFIDNGSMASFVSPRLIRRLHGIQPQSRAELHLQGFASEHRVVADKYAIRLQSAGEESGQVIIQAHEYEFGVDPPANCSEKMLRLIQQFGETHPLADMTHLHRQYELEPDLLIGVDQMYKILHLNRELEIGGGLIGKSSIFGWIVHGSFAPAATRGEVIQVRPTCCAATLTQTARDIEFLWKLETIGVTHSKKEEFSAEERDAMRQFRDGLVYDGQCYTVRMPKRDSISQLANNLDVARKRLLAKRRSLARDPPAFKRYDEEVMAFLRAGHAEEVPEIDESAPSSRDNTYFMPHRQVISPRPEGDKWRIVFDCSASASGEKSLNSQLLNGPNLNSDILKLLINFRLRAIALSADVAQAYLTIKLAAEDCPYFRYLWQGPSDARVRCFQMRKVTWGATPSGFLLAAVLREHFRRVDPNGTLDLGASFYFDDMLRSFDTESEAIQFVDKIVPMMKGANMILGKWKSNSSAVIKRVQNPESLSASTGLVESGLLRVLGIAWAPSSDAFQFRLEHLLQAATEMDKTTKRSVLRLVAAIYDPVGWLIPFTVRGKIIIQQLWSSGLGWDDPISDPVLRDFKSWSKEIPGLSELRIPRHYGNRGREVASYQLHIFGDASEKAYAAVAYLQNLYVDGGSSSVLIMAKSRIAPREKITLPRLELMAALLVVRLRVFIEQRLGVRVDRVTHYTDSSVAFYWCTAPEPSKYKTFVCNRVMEIQQVSKPEEWLHVDGKFNIADLPSRGSSVADLASNSEWWSGPSWLNDAESQRPAKRLRIGRHDGGPINEELRLVVTAAVVTPLSFDLERFGSWEKAVRVFALVLQFVQRTRRLPSPSVAEIRSRAEIYIIRLTQATHFAPEIAATAAGERPVGPSKLKSYRLFLDGDGLLRAQTRLSQSPHLTYDERNPIILPDRGRLAVLLVLHHHRTNAHLGVSAILNALRRRYWIIRCRQLIRKILQNCVVCKRVQGRTADQVQAPLPAERSTLLAAFAVTALDYCGPFYTRSREGTCKNYIALFTCTSIRAIHLELVPDQTAPQTHLAIRRFLAAYPACHCFISDNGKSFVRAAADIRRLFNSFRDPELREMLAQRRIDWSFNCPRAAWRGGVFERLVGVTKASLYKTLGRSLISAEELRTIISELAAVINNRPLSYTYADADEPRAITPSDFIRGGPLDSPICAHTSLDTLGPNGSVPPQPVGAANLRHSLVQRTSYFRALSVRWQREYLMLLRSANLDGKGKPRPVPNNSICLLRDDSLPRRAWNLVRVIEGHPGRDGTVRTYTVRFPNGFETRRAVQLLIPLEIPDQPIESFHAT